MHDCLSWPTKTRHHGGENAPAFVNFSWNGKGLSRETQLSLCIWLFVGSLTLRRVKPRTLTHHLAFARLPQSGFAFVLWSHWLLGTAWSGFWSGSDTSLSYYWISNYFQENFFRWFVRSASMLQDFNSLKITVVIHHFLVSGKTWAKSVRRGPSLSSFVQRSGHSTCGYPADHRDVPAISNSILRFLISGNGNRLSPEPARRFCHINFCPVCLSQSDELSIFQNWASELSMNVTNVSDSSLHPSLTDSCCNTAPLSSVLMLVLWHDRYTPHQNSRMQFLASVSDVFLLIVVGPQLLWNFPTAFRHLDFSTRQYL